jgi:hypothetical protein
MQFVSSGAFGDTILFSRHGNLLCIEYGFAWANTPTFTFQEIQNLISIMTSHAG